MQESKSSPAAAAPARCLVIPFLGRTGEAVPPNGSYHSSSSSSSAVYRLRSEDR